MIPVLYYGIGFFIYMSYSIITFKVYSKKSGMNKSFVLISIYIFYTLLAGYIINLVDSNASFFEKLIQTGIYALVNGLILNYYYSAFIVKDDIGEKYLTDKDLEKEEKEKDPYGF